MYWQPVKLDCKVIGVVGWCQSKLLQFYVNVNVIAFITCHKVNMVDTEARMVFLGGHPAKYRGPSPQNEIPAQYFCQISGHFYHQFFTDYIFVSQSILSLLA